MAYTVITGTGSVCVRSNVSYSGTGLVSVTNYYSWSEVGADSVNVGNTVRGVTSRGVGFTATLLGPGHFERRNSQFPSYSGDFTPGEPLLFATAAFPTYPGDIQIAFDMPVAAAGFRVEQNNATFRDDFFIDAGVTLSPPGSGAGLFVDASAPGANSTPFYGIAGGGWSETFTTLTCGFTGSVASGPAPNGYAISTLEVLFQCEEGDFPGCGFPRLLGDSGGRLLLDNGLYLKPGW